MATAVLAFGLSGCVEQDASLQLKGGVLATASAGDAACEMPGDYESAVTFSARGAIAGAELAEFGQPLIGDTYESNSRNVFYLGIAFRNRLPDSRNVGATGGGGSGGFEGLYLDQNSVLVTGATVSVPPELNDFGNSAADVDFEPVHRDFSAIAESGDGSIVMQLPLIKGNSELEQFYAFVESAGAREITFVLTVQLEGETFAGNKVTSNVYQYPVTICPSCDAGTTGLCAVKG
ncbi:hypothetical protein DL240_14880 [Lujinxingia litoralis]|uniref:Uncharacterized protein n=2 Tax=Lujinxingia litoralis TaxID=2211119 RepID=A0A328C8J0_9DELT|nr:hypothetical protein DL240_14880 [Lujinxingia litoralis]